jgi:alanine racemase
MKYDNFAFVVQDLQSIKALGATGKRIKLHLECNTGMNRYGAQPGEVEALVRAIGNFPTLTLEGVMSHLADSDGNDQATVDQAVKCFDECVEMVKNAGVSPAMVHVGQSAGSVKARSKYANMFRLGIGLYGINPFPARHELHGAVVGLKPAMQLFSTITKIIDLEPGDSVSYNYTFTASKRMKIGVLPVGYYEGVNRALSNAGTVKLHGIQVPIVGRVCMNHTMVSLDGVDAKVGDEVVVYSNDPADANSIVAIAEAQGLFSYNLLTSLCVDVRRRGVL